MAAKTKNEATEALKQLTYLAAALKAPRITEAAARLADHARDAGWTHEEYLAAVLDREVAARNASAGPGSRPARPSTTSTGTTSPLSANKSLRSPPGRSSQRPATSSCSALPAPARPTSPPRSA